MKTHFPSFFELKIWNKDCISSRRNRRWTNWICGIQ